MYLTNPPVVQVDESVFDEVLSYLLMLLVSERFVLVGSGTQGMLLSWDVSGGG